MKTHALAEMATAEMRVAFVNCIQILRRVNKHYRFKKASEAVKCDVYLQRFSNELRALAYGFDQMEAVKEAHEQKQQKFTFEQEHQRKYLAEQVERARENLKRAEEQFKNLLIEQNDFESDPRL